MNITLKPIRRGVTLMALLLVAQAISAQQNNINVELQTRIDWLDSKVEELSKEDPSNSGFRGRYLNLAISGNITPTLSVSWRQRMNKPQNNGSLFEATDNLTINYTPNKNWGFLAGKTTLSIGGWEYDRAPIDVYIASEFWQNIACYQFGAQASYTTNSGKDKFVAQLSQSPFDTPDTDLYGYDLLWYGTHGPYQSAHSVNLYQIAPDKHIIYIALGNRLNLGRWRIEVDLMSRTTSKGSIADNYSLMGELSYRTDNELNFFLRTTYDKCTAPADMCDMTLFSGTELTQMGGGIEYYPLGDKSLRIHALSSHVVGKNRNPHGTLRGGESLFNIGVTWKLSIVGGK